MRSAKWMCFALMGLAAIQASVTAQNISPRFAYKDVALQGRGSALVTGNRPGNNVVPNDYTGTAGPAGFGNSPQSGLSDQSSFLGNLARRGYNFINGGIQTALGIGRAGLNLFRNNNKLPAATQAPVPFFVGTSLHDDQQTSDYDSWISGLEQPSDAGEDGPKVQFSAINPNHLGNFHFRFG